VYNGPLRLTTPYFLSIGLGSYGGGTMSHESLQDIVSSPDASIPFLDGQVCISVQYLTPSMQGIDFLCCTYATRQSFLLCHPFCYIGLGRLEGGTIYQKSLQDILSSPDASIPFLDGHVCISVHYLTPKHEWPTLPVLHMCKNGEPPIMPPLLYIGLGK